jgi:hypothetical protein
MARILEGRWTADIDGDFVVFIIGFRASSSWKVVKALPLAASIRRPQERFVEPARAVATK